MLQHALCLGLDEQAAIDDAVMQDEAPVSDEIDIDDLDIGCDPTDVVALGELAADAVIAALVLDGVDACLEFGLLAARSGLASPLRSPIATDEAAPPASRFSAPAKPP